MPIDPKQLMNWSFQDVVQTYTQRDTMLYALALGLGGDPVDEEQLRFVYEANLQALPTFSLVLGDAGFWLQDPATGIDWPQVLYGEIDMEIHVPLPSAGTVVGQTAVVDLVDKGPSKGALLRTRRSVRDRESGALLCTLVSTYFCRSEGGFGGTSKPTAPPRALPERPADAVQDLPTLPQAALLYRLTGDFNPLHVDPTVAREAGFDRPILHGLCTFGVACYALLKALCGGEAARVLRMQARFSKPVYPGETIRTEIWRESAGQAGFRCTVLERDAVVLNHGLFSYSDD